jgi:photosystem II stability/assembly factor-like uncharacterized protein
MRYPIVLLLALTASATPLSAQTPSRTAAQSQFKGVFEPVSYAEDIDLYSVFFANGEVGWASGKAGTIIHTKDAGAKWTAQLGGDPGDKAEKIDMLRFVDERHGWAKQAEKLLATRNGESWEEIGTLPYTVSDMAFLSRTTGVLAGGADIYSRGGNTIYRTTDGGKTWKKTWTCTAKVQMAGLSRTLQCNIEQLDFVTPSIGYAVAQNRCTGPGCEPPPLIAKTTDGGLTWETMVGPGDVDKDGVTSIFFQDEKNGVARLTSKKLHITSDGGATWRGIPVSPGSDLRFADPSVGWALELSRTDTPISYTSDGGNRWTTREVRFPVRAYDYTLPRRDRGFVVGEHGMVFRYRVVPASKALGANDQVAPAMPGFDSPLDEQVAQLEKVVTDLAGSVGAGSGGTVSPAGAPASAEPAGSSGTSATASTDTASTGGAGASFDTPLPPPSTFTANCCKKNFNQLELILGALNKTLPEFIGKYRNLNLLLAAVRMGAELPGEYRSVREGLGTFKKAESKEEAANALATVSAALSALKQTTAISMQQQLPPVQP